MSNVISPDKYLFQVNVSLIIRNKKGEFLLAKRSDKDDIFPGLLCIPGGKMDIDDKNIEEALAREVYEEIAVKIDTKLNLYSNNTRLDKGINKLFLIYETECEIDQTKIKADFDEIMEVNWYKFEDINPESIISYTYKFLAEINNTK